MLKMKFIYVMAAIIFTLLSSVEIITGLGWGYRLLNLIAIACWYKYFTLKCNSHILPK